MSSGNPKVSIITPTYNSINTVLNTYNSIRNQTHTNWEWLVTDDCSEDGTHGLLSALSENDERIHVFKNPSNSGAAVTRNNSLSQATGEFIAFIDSDDLWLPDKLRKQLEYMSNNDGVDFSFTAYELIDENGNSLNKSVDLQGESFSVDYNDMLKKKATLGCSTVILNKSAFPDISMPLIRTGQDYALWLKLLKSGKRAYLVNQVLTQYRIMPNSISRNKFKKSKRQWSIYREMEKLPLSQSIYCFCYYVWRAVFRK
ncbi:glycosyltransferase family 2 protein [Kosakonia cowanii]